MHGDFRPDSGAASVPVVRPALAIAKYALLEAVRNRLLWLTGAFLLVAFLFAEFISEVALTEVREFQSGLMAALLRVCAVFILSLFVTTSVVREFNDKVLELVLAAPVPRSSYFLGKLAGYCGVAGVVAATYACAMLLYAPPWPVFIWGVSLWCELAIVIAACLLTLTSFGQVTVALSAVCGFYVLSRSIAAIAHMSDSPLLYSHTLSQQVLGWLVDGVAFVLPDLHRFTRSEWLIHLDAGWADLSPVLGQTAIYLSLLGAAALFDLYRKNL